MGTKQKLVKARALIEKPENWTKNYCFADRNGNQSSFNSQSTCKFCMWGALQKAHGSNDVNDALRALADAIAGTSDRKVSQALATVTRFNDTWNHDMVLKAFDTAIAAQE